MATDTVPDAFPTDEELRARVSANVKALREAKGISQYALAEAVGLRRKKRNGEEYVDVARIGKIERAEFCPGTAMVLRLARALDTTFEGLCGEKTPKKR